MKEIVVLSGKGGTGKTSITGGVAHIAGEMLVFADSDVDASNLHLILGDEIVRKMNFVNGYIANVDREKCSGCGICERECVFDSIHIVSGKAEVNEFSCEGCGLCEKLCLEKAIKTDDLTAGSIITYRTRGGKILVGAKMTSKRERSGKLVSEVKREAKEAAKSMDADYILVDGPPGIGCPAIASLGGADYAMLVTEPTLSGYHDVERVFSLIKHFKVKSGMIINKSDINHNLKIKLEQFAEKNGIALLGEIPYNEDFMKGLKANVTVAEQSPEVSKMLKTIWENIKKEII